MVITLSVCVDKVLINVVITLSVCVDIVLINVVIPLIKLNKKQNGYMRYRTLLTKMEMSNKSHKKGMGKYNGIAGYSGGRPSQAADKQLKSKVRKEHDSQPTLTFQVIIIFLFINLFICL